MTDPTPNQPMYIKDKVHIFALSEACKAYFAAHDKGHGHALRLATDAYLNALDDEHTQPMEN
jgi:hypothetical protein